MKTLVEIKPWVPSTAAGQGGAYVDNDLYFDWTAFKVPKGVWVLEQFEYLLRPSGMSGNAVNAEEVDFYFAKPDINGNAPPSLGTVNASTITPGEIQNVPTNLFNYFVGKISATDVGYGSVGDNAGFGSVRISTKGATCFGNADMIIDGDGMTTYYVAGIADGSIDHRTQLAVNAGDLTGKTITVDGVDPRDFLCVGDEIIDGNNLEIGTIAAMPDANTIICSTRHDNTLTDNDAIYAKNPVTMRLYLEG